MEVYTRKVDYDLTRLIERMDARHPTGVDRVDLRYALWTRSVAVEWRGVAQWRNGVSALEEGFVDQLLQSLKVRWLGQPDLTGAEPLLMPEVWRRESVMAIQEKLSRCSLRSVWQERGLSGVLLRYCPPLFLQLGVSSDGTYTDRQDDYVYWNVGHCFRFEQCMDQLLALYGSRSVFFVHDVIPLSHPKMQKSSSLSHFERFMRYVGDFNGRVIVSTQATVNVLSALSNLSVKRLQQQVGAICVAPLAVEPRFIKSPKAAALVSNSRTYFVCVGTIEPRKNIDLLISVWEQLSDMDIEAPSLLLFGKLGWFHSGQRECLKKLESSGLVEVRSGLEDSDLLCLMHGACALLFPSVAEGWGLPLTEALSLGVPVLASDLPVFREVGQGVPELLSPHAVELWRDAVLDYSSPGSGRRHGQMQRLSSYQPVTWKEHFEQLSRVLEN